MEASDRSLQLDEYAAEDVLEQGTEVVVRMEGFLREHKRGVGRVGFDVGEQGMEKGLNRMVEAGVFRVERIEHGHDRLLQVFQQAYEQSMLAGEMTVDGWLGDPDRFGYIAYGELLGSLPHDDVHGDLDDL